MSRLLYGDLDPEDVLLADLAYGSYVDLACVQQQGADAVFRSSPCASDGLSSGQETGDWGPSSRVAQAKAVSQAHE